MSFTKTRSIGESEAFTYLQKCCHSCENIEQLAVFIDWLGSVLINGTINEHEYRVLNQSINIMFQKFEKGEKNETNS